MNSNNIQMPLVSSEYQLKEKIAEVLANGLPLDNRVDGSNTFLHLAVLYNLKDSVERLLSAGADPLLLNSYGQSSLDIALENGNQILFHLLTRRINFILHVHSSSHSPGGCSNLLFTNSPVYEDYLDWTTQARIQKKQELIERLKQEERSSHCRLLELMEEKKEAVDELSGLIEVLRRFIADMSKEAEEITRYEARERDHVNLISQNVARIKKFLANVHGIAYWWGDVRIRRNRSVLTEKWDEAKLTIFGSSLQIQFDYLPSEEEDNNILLHSTENQDLALAITKGTEPFLSLKTGPVRRQIRKSQEALFNHLSKRKNLSLDLRQIRQLEVIKVGETHSLEKFMNLSYIVHSNQYFEGSKLQYAENGFNKSGLHDDFSRYYDTVNVIRIKVSEKLQSEMLSSFDHFVHVLKALNPELQISCEVDGKKLAIQEGVMHSDGLAVVGGSDSNSVLKKSFFSWKSKSSHGINKKLFDDNTGTFTLSGMDSEKAPGTNLNYSNSKQQSLSVSTSLLSSGVTSAESYSSIASVIQKPQSNSFLDGIEEEGEEPCRSSTDELPIAFGFYQPTLCKQPDAKSVSFDEHCIPMIIEEERSYDISYVQHMRLELARLRLLTCSITDRLESLLQKREELLAHKNYLHLLMNLINSPPFHSIQMFGNFPSMERIISLLSFYGMHLNYSCEGEFSSFNRSDFVDAENLVNVLCCVEHLSPCDSSKGEAKKFVQPLQWHTRNLTNLCSEETETHSKISLNHSYGGIVSSYFENRNTIGPPPLHCRKLYDSAMQNLEVVWNCELESFELAQRIANCISQRKSVWMELKSQVRVKICQGFCNPITNRRTNRLLVLTPLLRLKYEQLPEYCILHVN